MKIIKDLFTTLTVIALSLAVIALLPTDSDAAIYDDTLRLHILANSDTEEDQRLKLIIRDKLLEKYGEELKATGGIDEAKNNAALLLDQMKEDIDVWIAEEGFSYTSTVTVTEEWYDTREYDSFTLPKGYYSSLRVLLGNAEGKNWWCVMYPPLCLSLATEQAPEDDAVIDYTKEELSLIKGGGYNVKFRLLEIVSDALSRFGKK